MSSICKALYYNNIIVLEKKKIDFEQSTDYFISLIFNISGNVQQNQGQGRESYSGWLIIRLFKSENVTLKPILVNMQN